MYQKKAAEFELRKAEELIVFSEQHNENLILLLESLKERLPKASAQFKQLGGPWRSTEELQSQLRKCSLIFLEHLSKVLRPRLKLAGEDSYPILLSLLDLVEAHFYASMYDRAPEIYRHMNTQLQKIPSEKLGKLVRTIYKGYPAASQRDGLNAFIQSFGDGSYDFEKKLESIQDDELKKLGNIIKKCLKTEENKEVKQILTILERYFSATLIQRSQSL